MEPEYENPSVSEQDQRQQEQEQEDSIFNAQDAQEVVDLEGGEPMSDDEDGATAGPTGEQIEFPDTSIAAFHSHGEKSIFTLSLHPSFPNPPLAISGGEDDAGWIWSVFDGTPLVRLGGHTDSVIAAGFSADGKFAATGGMDGQVRVWSRVGESEERWTFAHSFSGPDEIVWFAWHPTAPILAAGATDSTVWMWHVPRGAHMGTFIGHTMAVTCGAWLPDGTFMPIARQVHG